MAKQFFATCVVARTRVVASVLQQGRSVECEGFGSCFCACMGQPSLFSEASGRGAAVSTQWFERPNQAQIAIDAAHARRIEHWKTRLTPRIISRRNWTHSNCLCDRCGTSEMKRLMTFVSLAL